MGPFFVTRPALSVTLIVDELAGLTVTVVLARVAPAAVAVSVGVPTVESL